MTDLLERYLTAVERRLPEKTAKDIVAELREVLSAKIEAREAAQKRGASKDDVAEILKAYGHPVVVASRYSGNDYVIGPNYYPWFWHVQRIVVGAAIAITFGIVAIRALGSEEPIRAALRGMGGAVEAALIAFAVVTALFIAAERTKLDLKWTEKWDPKTLPRDNVREPKGLLGTSITLVFDIVFLLWWTKVVSFPNEIPVEPGTSSVVAIHLSDAWNAVWWPVLVLGLAATLVHAVDLVRPAWSRWRSVLSILGHASGLVILWALYRSQPLVSATPVAGADGEQAERMFRLFDSILQVSLGVAAVISAVTIGVEVWRLWRAARPASPSALPA